MTPKRRPRPTQIPLKHFIQQAFLLSLVMIVFANCGTPQIKEEKAVLDLPVFPESQTSYDRKTWKHWIDTDKDCQNTRHELLITSSLQPVELDEKGCRALRGSWFDPYSGKTYLESSKLDIDHVVPLKEAHESGGFAWSAEQKERFANDPQNLLPVWLSQNRSKGDRDPAEWMPQNTTYHCDYIRLWISVKNSYQLSADANEYTFLQKKLAECS